MVLPQSIQKQVQKGYNLQILERLPLQQTASCNSHHPNLVDCLNTMCSSYFVKVWWTLSKDPWDSGRYALDLNCFVFNLIDAKLAEIN
jgi:hypothetical protein